MHKLCAFRREFISNNANENNSQQVRVPMPILMLMLMLLPVLTLLLLTLIIRPVWQAATSSSQQGDDYDADDFGFL